MQVEKQDSKTAQINIDAEDLCNYLKPEIDKLREEGYTVDLLTLPRGIRQVYFVPVAYRG